MPRERKPCCLCRYRSAGRLNTPFGRYRKPYFPEKEMLNFWEKANNALFFCCDFRETMAMAEPGDVVYCGPPYVPLSNTANFTSYNGEGFGPEEQRAPARMISFGVRRCVGCDGGNRGKAVEVLILFAAGGGAA